MKVFAIASALILFACATTEDTLTVDETGQEVSSDTPTVAKARDALASWEAASWEAATAALPGGASTNSTFCVIGQDGIVCCNDNTTRCCCSVNACSCSPAPIPTHPF